MSEPAPLRWWHRAVPVGLLALACSGAAAWALPADEVERSTSRVPQEFVELHLMDPPRAVCRRAGRSVRFRVVSHLTAPTALRFRVTVDLVTRQSRQPGQRRARLRDRLRDRGRVHLLPGEAAVVRARLGPRPARAHHVTVRLPQRTELLRVRCAGARR